MNMKKKIIHLTTADEEKMNKELPWNEYPRPSLVRDSFFCLNGLWDFEVNKEKVCDSYSEKILVPFPAESRLSGYCKEIPKGCFLHYKREFSLPDGFLKDRVILHFGAVDTVCEVFLNGKSLGGHEGGYLPFSFDITELLAEKNILTVTVRDDLDKAYPYGKQTKNRGGMWYTPVSGIWQTVWLESVTENYITKISVKSDTEKATIRVFGGENKKKITLLESGEIFEFEGEEITISPKEKRLWSPENPNLYNFVIESGEDSVSSYFALRSITSEKVNGIPRLCLNGKPYLFNGLLDQGYFPEGIFLPATSDGFKNDILTVKSLGFNMLRKHIKVEPEIFYHLCDTLGIVVFQDMVNNSGYSFILDTALPTVGLKRLPDNFRHKNKKSREIFIREMNATIEHTEKFPSVLYYTIFNEGWGQFSADKVYEIAKAKAPDKIFDSTSGWFVRHKSDVDSRHVYFKAVKLGSLTHRPIVISEFGGYSHRIPGHLSTEDNYGYKLYETREQFEEGFFNLYENEILPLLPKGISALVYTQVSDIEDETNGLLTYDRRILKVDRDKTFSLMKRLSQSIEKTETNQ